MLVVPMEEEVVGDQRAKTAVEVALDKLVGILHLEGGVVGVERSKVALGRALLTRSNGLAQDIRWDRDEEGAFASVARKFHVPKSAIKAVRG